VWRIYDANKALDPEQESDGFKPGNVEFTQVIVPDKVTAEIPAFALSFFDPDEERYITKRLPAIPITVKPDSAGQPTLTGVIDSASVESPSPSSFPSTAVPLVNFDDVMHIRTGAPQWLGQAVPGRPGLAWWTLQVVGSIALTTLIALGILRGVKRRRAAYIDWAGAPTFSDSLRTLSHRHNDRSAFYRSASRILRLWTEEKDSVAPELRKGVESKLADWESIVYSPHADSTNSLSTAESREVQDFLRALPKP
ncbi:MAG: hypothetical protein AAF236_13090, partial [Verrucomicrobiota bacterium]